MMMRKPNTTEGTGSVRRDRMFLKAIEMRLGGGRYILDCYSSKVITDGVSMAITTRIDGCNNYFLLEINDGEAKDKGSD